MSDEPTGVWSDDADADDFTLPGDAERVEAVRAAQEEEGTTSWTPEDEAAAPAAAADDTAAADQPAKEDATGRLHGPDGKFIKKGETPAADEQPAEPGGDEQTAAERLYAGNFKTVDDLERGYVELRQKLSETRPADADEQLRDLQQQLQQMRAELQREEYDPDDLEAYFEENPHNIPTVAERARQSRNTELYEAAMAAWYERDPKNAHRYELWQITEQLRGEQAQATAPIRDQEHRTEWSRAMGEFAKDKPEFQDEAQLQALSQRMGEAAEQNPRIFTILRDPNADVGTKVEILDFLYHKAKGSVQPGSLSPDLAREHVAQTQQARRDAILVSATATATDTPSEAERIGQEWDEFERPYADGWRIG